MHTAARVAGGRFCGEFQCANYDMGVNNRFLRVKGARNEAGRRQQRRLRQPRNRPVGCKCPCPTTGVTTHGCVRRASSRLLLFAGELAPTSRGGTLGAVPSARRPRDRLPGLESSSDASPGAVPRTRRTLHARVGGKMPQGRRAGKSPAALNCAEAVTIVH